MHKQASGVQTSGSRPPLTGIMAFLDRFSFLVLGVVLVGAFASSTSAPLGGLFVVDGLGEAPWKISVAAIVKVVVTLLTNRYYGHAIDRGVPVRRLLLISISCFTVGMMIIGTFQVYWVYAGVASVLIGVGSGALSVVYSFGRLFAEQTGRDVKKFNSYLRMQTSLGWMVGPAISLSVYGAFGFTAIYFAIAALGAVWLLFCFCVVPAAFKTHHPGSITPGQKVPFNLGLVLACIPVYLISTGHVLFLTAMPLYFTASLGLAPAAAGFELTVKCFVEVIAIYASAGVIQRMGERKGLMVAASCAVLFFALVYHAQTLLHVLALGALDGLYYGLFAAIGMTFVQNFARHRPGMATSYYISTLFVGGLTGNLLMGTIANWYSFHATVAVSGFIVAIGGLVLLVIGDAPAEDATPQQA
ncbi:MFS transporter [Thalassospira mesophila]|uniref:Sugar transporter n=1 Tax=Thalassospira mesophila TaxID=1293891 RepID=A0A1Y2L603_9PROT|nr:MFS transporter [Thalassospira mesophila]OSQ39943.1 sugar transporter [Thalassospira mesophila]